jgi:hypothetical protein
MEMNDQILNHIMNVQTQLLQQMIKMEQDRNSTISQPATTISPDTGSFGTPLPSSIASPVTPPPVQHMSQPGTPFMSVNDPTRYGTYAAPNQGYWSRQNQAAQSGFRNFIGGTIDEMKNFDPMGQSREATEQYFARQSRGMQEQTVNILGGAIHGAASVGSFFVPGGLAASLAVGGAVAGGVGLATNAMVNGAKTSLDYQELLQNNSYKFINAFESTSDLGGTGFGLNDRQEISGFLRDLSTDKYLDDNEMMKILDGAASNNLLKSVSDVKSFKKKFTEIVDTVKAIAVTMNESVEEATKFMGEMERMGISNKDMSYLASQSKVTSSFMGISSNEGAQMMLNTTNQVVQGTALNSKNIAESTNETGFIISRIAEGPLRQYIKNNGGEGNVTSQVEQLTRNYVTQGAGLTSLLGYFGSGFQYNEKTREFEVNEKEMNRLLNGNMSRSQMQQASDSYMNSLSDDERYRLLQSASTVFNNYADTETMARFMQRNVQMLQQETPMDEQTALTNLGMAQDLEQAKLLEEYINNATDPNILKAYKSQALKNEQDSKVISESPGFSKRLKFWWQRVFENPLGDKGQAVSDFTGDLMQDYQKILTGIDDTSTLGGDASLEKFDQKGLEKVLKNSKDLMDYGITKPGEADLINQDLDESTFSSLMSQVQKGKISASDLDKALKNNKGWMSKWRASMLKSEAKGTYDDMGLLGDISYGIQRGILWASDKIVGNQDDFMEGVEDTAKSTFDDFKDQEKGLNQQLNRLVLDGGLDPDKVDQIEKAIKKGDMDKVRSYTNNREAINLADKFNSLGEKENQFERLTRYTTSMTQAGSQLAGVFQASGAFDEEEIDSMFGSLRRRSKKIRDKIKEGDMSASGMAQFDSDTMAKFDKMFDNLPDSDLRKLAHYLNEKYDAGLNEKNVNADKLQEFLLNTVVRDQHITEPNKGSGKAESKTDEVASAATKAAEEHQQAFYSFLNTYKQETQMMKDAVEGRPIRNTKSSSLSYTG